MAPTVAQLAQEAKDREVERKEREEAQVLKDADAKKEVEKMMELITALQQKLVPSSSYPCKIRPCLVPLQCQSAVLILCV